MQPKPRIRVNSIQRPGELGTESVWIHAILDDNLRNYVLIGTLLNQDGTPGPYARVVYWFPNKRVRSNDWIVVYTKKGTPSSKPNNQNTTTHKFFLGREHAVWNIEVNCAVLFRASGYSYKSMLQKEE